MKGNNGWLVAVLGFLLGDLGEYAVFLRKRLFDQLFLCMLPFNVAPRFCCYFGVVVFSGPRKSGTSQHHIQLRRLLEATEYGSCHHLLHRRLIEATHQRERTKCYFAKHTSCA